MMYQSKLTPYDTLFICFKPFYIGYMSSYIENKKQNTYIYIYTYNNIDKITEIKSNNNIKEIKNININKKHIYIYEPLGISSWTINIEKTSSYNKPIFVPHKKIITNVVDKYISNKNNKIINNSYLGCLFYGNPGSGKSSIGFNIAHYMDSIIVNNYDPTIQGLSIISFLIRQDMDNNKPILIIINEFDKIIEACYNETLEMKTEYIRDAWSKTTLNNLIDKLSMMNGIILICTTNKDISWYNENNYDSTIRKGRFDIIKKIDKIDKSEINELDTLGYKCSGYLNTIIKK